MSIPLTDEWGGNAKRAREAAGLTQTMAAAAAGTTQNNLSRIERGEQLPMYELQLRLAETYGVSVTALFPRDDSESALVGTVAELELSLGRVGNGCS